MMVVGTSNGNNSTEVSHGIVMPQSDMWMVSNARFYNFMNGAAALGDCSLCMTVDGDSGARTTRFSKLKFDDSTVTARVNFLDPLKGIFHDLDGTLTGQGADSYLTAYWPHLDVPACTVNMELYSGIICPSPYAVQRILLYQTFGDARG